MWVRKRCPGINAVNTFLRNEERYHNELVPLEVVLGGDVEAGADIPVPHQGRAGWGALGTFRELSCLFSKS